MVKTRHPGIYKRGGRYVVVYRADGRQRKESARTLDEARALKRSRETARDRGELHRATAVTFRQACDEWLRYVEHDRQRRHTTLRGYRNVVDAHLVPEFGEDTPLGRITTERIDAYRERLLAGGKISRRTAQQVLVLLHGVLQRAKQRRWLAVNPAEDAEKVTLKRSGEFNVLSPAEVLAVTRAAESERDGALFTVAAFTGLRLGELRALRWGDVDFANATIRAQRSYTHGRPGPPKSGLVRSIPLIDQAARALDGLSRRAHFTAPGDLVFATLAGGHCDDSTVRRRFKRAVKAAGLEHKLKEAPPLRFHDLRHTFGTIAVQVWPLVDVKAYMGHADIATTMIYAHHVPKRNAAAALTRFVQAESGNRVATDGNASSGTGPLLATPLHAYTGRIGTQRDCSR
jgi:integrase